MAEIHCVLYLESRKTVKDLIPNILLIKAAIACGYKSIEHAIVSILAIFGPPCKIIVCIRGNFGRVPS